MSLKNECCLPKSSTGENSGDDDELQSFGEDNDGDHVFLPPLRFGFPQSKTLSAYSLEDERRINVQSGDLNESIGAIDREVRATGTTGKGRRYTPRSRRRSPLTLGANSSTVGRFMLTSLHHAG